MKNTGIPACEDLLKGIGTFRNRWAHSRCAPHMNVDNPSALAPPPPPQLSVLVVSIAAVSQHPRRVSCDWYDWSDVPSDPPVALPSRSSTTWSSSLLPVSGP